MKTKEQFVEEAKIMMKVRGGCKPFCFCCDKWIVNGDNYWRCCMSVSAWQEMRVYCASAAERWAKEITGAK